eukprot:CAMPEP_0197285194 /NCGR_PEP_ID=MMETSP0890-20130614/414_1 /TAXON_ID=44058 ORGANISM="Aureoumbra lagunensis, Strain CCMP1510" /NCGR_SAMPLE_ID=MMETSP0890 /ASSEMBLY_ACC=CAM_ASM_000533 /LENGTH=319 /DNA_ID=CAMNT_0042752473 /DNA_START=175 /DNA_END=1130 /DNA_ORIENTATION=-
MMCLLLFLHFCMHADIVLSSTVASSYDEISSALSDNDDIEISSDVSWYAVLNITYDCTVTSYGDSTYTIDGGGSGTSSDGASRIFRVTNKATLTLQQLNIEYTGASGDGAAFVVHSGSSLTLSDVKIAYSYSDSNGGAIYCDGCHNLYIYDSSFAYCTASSYGGVFYISSTTGTVELDSVQTKTSESNKGVLYLESSDAYISGGKFASNYGYDIALGNDAAIYYCGFTYETILEADDSIIEQTCDWTVVPSISPAPSWSQFPSIQPSSLSTAVPTTFPSTEPSLVPTTPTPTTAAPTTPTPTTVAPTTPAPTTAAPTTP